MTFYNYVKKNYKGQDNPKGDFCDDMLKDENGKCAFQNENYGHFVGYFKLMMAHLASRFACSGCIDVFIELYYEYVINELRRRKKSEHEAMNSPTLKNLTKEIAVEMFDYQEDMDEDDYNYMCEKLDEYGIVDYSFLTIEFDDEDDDDEDDERG